MMFIKCGSSGVDGVCTPSPLLFVKNAIIMMKMINKTIQLHSIETETPFRGKVVRLSDWLIYCFYLFCLFVYLFLFFIYFFILFIYLFVYFLKYFFLFGDSFFGGSMCVCVPRVNNSTIACNDDTLYVNAINSMMTA